MWKQSLESLNNLHKLWSGRRSSLPLEFILLNVHPTSHLLLAEGNLFYLLLFVFLGGEAYFCCKNFSCNSKYLFFKWWY